MYELEVSISVADLDEVPVRLLADLALVKMAVHEAQAKATRQAREAFSRQQQARGRR